MAMPSKGIVSQIRQNRAISAAPPGQKPLQVIFPAGAFLLSLFVILFLFCYLLLLLLAKITVSTAAAAAISNNVYRRIGASSPVLGVPGGGVGVGVRVGVGVGVGGSSTGFSTVSTEYSLSFPT